MVKFNILKIMIIKKCNNCNITYEIRQVGIPSGNRDRETAECPNCKEILHSDKISGTFEVKEKKD